MDSHEDGPPDTNWCVGGCEEWRETEDGRKRYEELRERWLAVGAAGKLEGTS